MTTTAKSPPKTTAEKKRLFAEYVGRGLSQAAAARAVGVQRKPALGRES